ncbi:MAG: glycosyltransferase family 4 protein [Candidatus Marinimicrobia bacterium]|nr:glycosyltransferase family 4 protein [Candidatus Neomarinimicrobiota bacterium]
MKNINPHICHVTVGHNPTDDRIFYKECSSLARKYSRISLVAPKREEVTTKNNVSFVLYQEKSFFKNLGIAYRTAKALNADLYHIHEFELLPYFLWLKFRYGKTIIYDAHETIYYYFMEFTRRPKYLIWPIAVLAQAIEWICSAFVDQVITVTPWVAEGFKPFNHRLDLIYNYPLLTHFETGAVQKSNFPLVLYPGQISPARNIELMVESMKYVREKIPYAKLLLMGITTPWFKQTLDEIIQKNSLQDQIEIRPPVPYQEIPRLMKSAHVGLASMAPNESFKRSIQIKPFEYMYCKVPVIAAKVPSTILFVKNHQAGIVLEEISAQSLAAAIITILSNAEMAASMGEKGHEAVKEKYNWQEMETKLYQIYEEVLHR